MIYDHSVTMDKSSPLSGKLKFLSLRLCASAIRSVTGVVEFQLQTDL